MKIAIILISLFALTAGYKLDSLTVAHGHLCDICIDTLAEIKSATTSEEIEKLVTDLAAVACKFTPKSLRPKCEAATEVLIRENFAIIRQLTDIFAPEDLCRMMWMCPKENNMVESVDGAPCTLCQDLMGLARYTLTDESLRKFAKTFIKANCIFAGPFAKQCKEAADELVDTSFDYFKQFFDQYSDEELCQQVHLCKGNDFTAVERFNPNICEVCTATVTEITGILVMDEFETAVEDTATFACSLLPSSLADDCTVVVQDFLEENQILLKEFLKDFTPTQMCSLVHLCSSADGMTNLALPSMGPLCNLCEDYLHLFRAILTDPALEAMIDADLKFACSFTSFLHRQCEGLADNFVKTIFEKVRGVFDNFDDHENCVLFNFCPNESNTTTICKVCEDGYETVKEFATSESLQTLIKDQLDIACIAFGPLKRICVKEANKIVDMMFSVVHVVLDDVDGEKFCSKIHLCKKVPFY